MNSNQRKALYATLAGINAVLLVLVQQNLLPAQYAHYAAVGSFALAAAMKEFAAPDPAPKDPSTDAGPVAK